ncbi:MAG: type II secretion system major pseudopilin GspG [Pseudomonadota bacterium]|nr:type II secretion system major pseudopilin GspG [Pseudomonadota bacterium]
MQHAIPRSRTGLQQGFTLIEIMVVVVILGILAALIAPNLIGRIDEARVTAARNDIRTIESALQLYRMDNFRYPSTEEGVEALVTKPDDPDIKWPEGGYLQRLPKDPWDRPYLYLQPGNNGIYDLYSFGRDGQQDGEGPDADIGNWNLN